MPTITHRHQLKLKVAKALLKKMEEALNLNLSYIFGDKPRIEVAKTSFGNLIIVNGRAIAIKLDEETIPTLIFSQAISKLPKVIVDMGAIPHICNGADVMAPGIVRVEGEFGEGAITLIVDERYGKPLAIGRALMDSDRLRMIKRGRVVKNIHYVGDKIWRLIKEISR